MVHYENTPIQIYTENLISKNWKFSDKKLYIFHISAQNIDCGYSLEPPRWGGSNEYQQSMFLSRNKKNKVYPCKPRFYYIKVGFKGSKLYRYVFMMTRSNKQIKQLIKTANSQHLHYILDPLDPFVTT